MNKKVMGSMAKGNITKRNISKKSISEKSALFLIKRRMKKVIRRFIRRMITSRRYRILAFRYSLAVVISAIFIPMMLSLAFAQPAEANDGSEEVFYKYYHRIEVAEGDSLWSIAQQNYLAQEQTIREYIEEVKQINHRYGETIYAGEKLMIPYYSTEFR